MQRTDLFRALVLILTDQVIRYFWSAKFWVVFKEVKFIVISAR